MELWYNFRRMRDSVVNFPEMDMSVTRNRALGLAAYKKKFAEGKKWDAYTVNKMNPEFMFVWKLNDRNWAM